MKKILYIILGLLIIGGGIYGYKISHNPKPVQFAGTIVPVFSGGTGASTLTGCLTGNGTSPITGTGVACSSGSGGSSQWATSTVDSTAIYPAGAVKVGIGTTTPWGQLSVNPDALGSGVPEFVIGSSTKTRFIVTGNGGIGIGTTSPYGKFSIRTDGNTAAVAFNISNTNNSARASKFTILDTGYVGITADSSGAGGFVSTTSPGWPLTVQGGNDTGSNTLALASGPSDLAYLLGRNNNTGDFDIKSTQGGTFYLNFSGGAKFTSTVSVLGNALLTQWTSFAGFGNPSGGGGPNQAVEIRGGNSGLRIGGDADNYFDIIRSSGTGYLNFTASQNTFSGYSFSSADSSNILYLKNNGLVGISTSTPVAKIDSYTTASTTNMLLEAVAGKGGCLTVKDSGGSLGYTEIYTVAGVIYSKVATSLSTCN